MSNGKKDLAVIGIIIAVACLCAGICYGFELNQQKKEAEELSNIKGQTTFESGEYPLTTNPTTLPSRVVAPPHPRLMIRSTPIQRAGSGH